MICKTGGFVSLRHNELCDLTGNMLREACRNVEVEPLLRYQTSIKEDNARLDLSALGFWRRGEKAVFDIRVFDPVAQSHFNQNLQTSHLRQENEKRRQYEERVLHVKHASFTPLVFTIAGGMGKAAQTCFSRLAEMLAVKRPTEKHCHCMDAMPSVFFSSSLCHSLHKRNKK